MCQRVREGEDSRRNKVQQKPKRQFLKKEVKTIKRQKQKVVVGGRCRRKATTVTVSKAYLVVLR